MKQVLRAHRGFWVLVLFSLSLHLAWLGTPNSVVFDEVHFGKFVNSYCCTAQNFFDIHPPHGKLIIAGVVSASSYTGYFPFEAIGDPYDSGVPIELMRLPGAIAGALVPLVLYLFIYQLGGSKTAALAGGWLATFDTALTTQSRLIGLDSMLLLATLGSLTAVLTAIKIYTPKQRLWLLVATGVLVGLAPGIKFTGLAVPFLVLAILVWAGLHTKHLTRHLRYAAGVMLVAVMIYASGWVAHFSLLTNPGPGDSFYTVDRSGPAVVTMLRETVRLHEVMLSANYGITTEHPYASRWWTWPLSLRAVFYWQQGTSFIYFLGNPVVWWGAFAGLVVAVVKLVIDTGNNRRVDSLKKIAVPLLGYTASFLPLAHVSRPLFLYHYLTPLLFSIVISVLFLDQRGHLGQRLLSTWMIAAAAGFIFFSPLVYGVPLSENIQPFVFWFSSWR